MFREYFVQGKACRLLWAWTGLLVFLGHQAFKAYLSWAINDWYEDFYDLMQDTVEYASGSDTQTDLAERASGSTTRCGTLPSSSRRRWWCTRSRVCGATGGCLRGAAS